MNAKRIRDVSHDDVETLFSDRETELHRKVDATRDAYFGFIFPVTRADFSAVASALDMNAEMSRALYRQGTTFSTFRMVDRGGQLTNHIVGAALLALRGKDLDTGLAEVDDGNLKALVAENEGTVLEIAEARRTWFGRIYFPAAAFANAFSVFGGKVSPKCFFGLARDYGYAATATERQTIRGDFGIGVWLTLMANA